jgi:phosphoenolpyruvate-protein phosphotransferase
MPVETLLSGRIIAPGAGLGYVSWEQAPPPVGPPTPLEPQAVEGEIARLQAAIVHLRKTVELHVKEFHAPAHEDAADVLSAHLLMLDDSRFFANIFERIKQGRLSAEHALEAAFLETANRLLLSGDPYLQVRAEEIRDLFQSLRRAMMPENSDVLRTAAAQGPVVVVARSLCPDVVLRARCMRAAGFISSSEAFTSHGAILLRASGIPSLGGVELPPEGMPNGTPVLVDALGGELHLRPSDRTRRRILRLAAESVQTIMDRVEAPLHARTADGTEVRLAANIDHPSHAAQCLQQRLSGVGLLRTEYMVLERGRIPGEQEQIAVYRELFRRLAGRPVVVRTFDIGGDKTAPGLHHCTGLNPALGVRGLRRHLLRHPDEIRAQLRAILRAASDVELGIVFPMVTHAGDVRHVLGLLEGVRSNLETRGEAFNHKAIVGAMIEVPSAALGIAEILPLVDFVSIGTNDLLQYLTASDRDNAEVVHYQGLESSGLHEILTRVVAEARRLGRGQDVTVCGELASDPEGARFLVRHGIRSLSVSPQAAPMVRQALGSLSLVEIGSSQ